MGSVGTSEIVTDDSETFRLDNFEPVRYYPTQYSNPEDCHCSPMCVAENRKQEPQDTLIRTNIWLLLHITTGCVTN